MAAAAAGAAARGHGGARAGRAPVGDLKYLADTKINHLSYVGDADFGRNVNVGAGTVTANYDGVNKHRTVIGDDSKTGANSVLVAPITLGRGVTVGAGSALTKNVPDGALALGRARQTVIENWAGPRPQG